MTTKRLIAIIDKSVFQRIAELPSGERCRVWDQLKAKVRLAIPFVAIEEVLSNRPESKSTSKRTAEIMLRDMMKLKQFWLTDEIELLFHEIILGNKDPLSLPFPERVAARIASCSPNQTRYKEFMEQRSRLVTDDLRRRMDGQDQAGRRCCGVPKSRERWENDEHGRPVCLIPDLKFFVENFIEPHFRHNETRPDAWDKEFASLRRDLLQRFPTHADEIENSLKGFSSTRLKNCPVVYSRIIVKLFYYWLPIVRLGNELKQSCDIIGRSKSHQRNNIHDERYVTMSLLCDTILTRDEEMAKVCDCLAQLGIWRGRSTYFPAGKSYDIRGQIYSFLGTL